MSRRPGRGGSRLPPLPQIRTCPIKASGSSCHGLAAHGCPRAAGRQLRYLLLFRGHRSRSLPTGHVSSQQFRDTAPPSLRRVPAGRVPRPRRYYEALRFPTDHPVRLRLSFAGQYPPVRLCSSLPPARRRPGDLGYSGLATPCQSLSRGSRRASQVPGEPPCAYAVFFDPGGTGDTRP